MTTVLTTIFLCICLQAAFLQPVYRGGQLSIRLLGDCASSLTVQGSLAIFSETGAPAAIPNGLKLCREDGNCSLLPKVPQDMLESGSS